MADGGELATKSTSSWADAMAEGSQSLASPSSRRSKKGGIWVSEGRSLAKGVRIDRTRWNKVTVGGSTFTVERAPQLQAEIDLEQFQFTPAFEKHGHKERCTLCKMYFERTSVSKMVSNHRILDLQRCWNMPLEGRRYQTCSFIYASSLVCTFCAQLFQDAGELPRSLNTAGRTDWQGSLTSDSASSVIGEKAFESIAGEGEVGEHGFSVASKGGGGSLHKAGSLTLSPSAASPSKLRRGPSLGRSPSVASTSSSDLSANIRNVEESERLHVSTVLRRSDVAPGNRCYQSSTVDSLSAEVAISPPYARTTRTRREVDPWWEVDFSRRVHLESISLQALTGHMQRIFISVLLLSQPTGFEDPFLDSVIPKSVVWKEFQLPESSAPKLESIEWTLPPNSVCTAIRVQIRGIHTLSLGSFQAYMGDDYLEERDVEINMTKNSYATMSLADLKLAREAMVSPEQKRARLRLAKLEAERRSVKRKNASRAEIEGRLSSISQLIDQRFRYIDAWRSHVLTFVAELEEEFINRLYHLVFVAAVNEGLRGGTAKNNLPPNRSLPQTSSRVVSSRDIASRQRCSRGRPAPPAAAAAVANAAVQNNNNNNGAAAAADAEADDATAGSGFFLTEDASQHSGAGTGPDSPQSTVAEDRRDDESEQSYEVTETLTYGVADSELEDYALTCHYPRCELQDLYMRIRGLLVQISSRHNLKSIGVLGSDETMASIAEDYNDYLPGLQKEFRLIDEAWQRSFDASRDKDGKLKKEKKDPTENRGICWSQFLIIFRLFMQKRFKEMAAAIQPPAFKAELSTGSATRREAAAAASAAAAALLPYEAAEERDNSKPSTPLGTPEPGARKAWSGPGGKLTGLGAKMPGDRLAALLAASTMSPSYGGPLLKASPVEAPLLFNARDPAMPVLDTRFSEYKLTSFRRRVAGEMEFPPTLTLDFTQKLLDFQKSKAQQRSSEANKSATASAGAGGAASASAAASAAATAANASAAVAASAGAAEGAADVGAEAGVAAEPALVFVDDFSRAESKSAQPKERDYDPSEEIGAPRSCALCVYTFPRSATATQVMWKHVITLRRLWDPDGSLGLVPKEVELLEQGTSMFNLVNVCPLCYQFFDPDLADSAYPNTLKRNIKAIKKSAIGLPSADTPVTDPFLDERYPLRDANLFADRSMLESRHRARKLLDLLAAQREGAEDETSPS